MHSSFVSEPVLATREDATERKKSLMRTKTFWLVCGLVVVVGLVGLVTVNGNNNDTISAKENVVNVDSDQMMYCPSGYFLSAGSCRSCLPGTYQDRAGMTSCKPAPRGHSAPEPRMTAPVKCEEGKYQANTGMAACDLCPAGTFSKVTGALACERCSAGSYQPREGQTSCLNVPCGHVAPLEGSAEPTPCKAGEYQPSEGRMECLVAPAGSFTDGIGKCITTQCAEGSYQPLTGQTRCMNAPCGHIAPRAGLTQAVPCDAGEYQSESGQTKCVSTLFDMAPNPGTCHEVFYGSSEKKSWADAKAWCESRGDRLAIVKSESVHQAVEKACVQKATSKGMCWIGGSNSATQGKWIWVDGTEVGPYQPWDTNKPNAQANENCLMTGGTKWSDGLCARPQSFVCERRFVSCARF